MLSDPSTGQHRPACNVCGGRGTRTPTPAQHRPNGFQDRPLKPFEYTSIFCGLYGHRTHPLISRISTPLRAIITKFNWSSSTLQPRYFVEKKGLEPSTLCLQSRCSSQLSYNPKRCLTSIVGIRHSIRSSENHHFTGRIKTRPPICASLGAFLRPTSGSALWGLRGLNPSYTLCLHEYHTSFQCSQPPLFFQMYILPNLYFCTGLLIFYRGILSSVVFYQQQPQMGLISTFHFRS